MSESDSNQSNWTGFDDLEEADIRYYRQLSPEARENARKLRDAGVI